MTAQHEIQGIIYRLLREYIGIGIGQEVVLKAKALDVPSCPPDTGAIGNSVWGFGSLTIENGLVVSEGRTEDIDELAASLVLLLFKLFGHASGEPACAGNHLDDGILLGEDKVEVFGLARGQIQFDGGL